MHKSVLSLFFLGALIMSTANCLEAKLISKDIVYVEGSVKLKGYFVYDDQYTSGGEKIPGVLVAPEWWGVNDYARQRAQQLAGLGYAALVIDMYGDGKNTTNAKEAASWAGAFYSKPEAMAGRAKAGLNALTMQPEVDAHKLAAIGYCFGGAVCQSLVYDGAPLLGIVSFHGSLIPATAEQAAKVKNNGVKFLICHGAIDPHVKAEDVAAFKTAFDQGGVDYELIMYSGAVHAFTNPGADAVAKANNMPGIAYNAVADKHSWESMRQFLAELFK